MADLIGAMTGAAAKLLKDGKSNNPKNVKPTPKPETINDPFQRVVDTYSADVVAPPANTPVNVTTTTENANEIIGQNSGQVSTTAPTVNVAQGTTQQAAAPDAVQTSVVDAAKAGDKVEGVLDQFNYAKGTVEDKSTVKGEGCRGRGQCDAGASRWATAVRA